jgi:hypothetical protein
MQRRNQRKDTPAELAWRLAHNAVLEQVAIEHANRPLVTAENVDAELVWQATRIAELMKAKGF